MLSGDSGAGRTRGAQRRSLVSAGPRRAGATDINLLPSQSAPVVRTRVDLRGVRLEERRGREQWPYYPGRGSVTLAVAGTDSRAVRSRISVLHRLARFVAPSTVCRRFATGVWNSPATLRGRAPSCHRTAPD